MRSPSSMQMQARLRNLVKAPWLDKPQKVHLKLGAIQVATVVVIDLLEQRDDVRRISAHDTRINGRSCQCWCQGHPTVLVLRSLSQVILEEGGRSPRLQLEM